MHISKDGNLLWFQFHQLLIEHYSNIPYASDALNAYGTHMVQGEHMRWLHSAWLGPKCFWNVSIILLRCATFQEVVMTTFTWFKVCTHTHLMIGCIWTGHLMVNGRCIPDNRSCYQVWGARTGTFFKPNLKPAHPVLQVSEVKLGEATRYNHIPDWSYNG